MWHAVSLSLKFRGECSVAEEYYEIGNINFKSHSLMNLINTIIITGAHYRNSFINL
jgi:hypothetical protein